MTPVKLIGLVQEKKYHNKRAISYYILLMINMKKS